MTMHTHGNVNISNTADLRVVKVGGEDKLVLNLPVATDVFRSGKKETIFLTLSLWDKVALAAAKNLEVGQQVYFTGGPETVSIYTNNKGEPTISRQITQVSSLQYGSPINSGRPVCAEHFVPIEERSARKRASGPSTVATTDDIAQMFGDAVKTATNVTEALSLDLDDTVESADPY